MGEYQNYAIWDWKLCGDYDIIKCKIMIGGIGLELNFFQCLLFGFLSGLTDILPVSAQAHKAMLLSIFGLDSEPTVLRLLIHAATLAALFYCCRPQIIRISRQLKLAKVPKKRRKRPLDMRTILDFKLLRTMLIPMVLGYLFYQKTSVMNLKLNWVALFSLVNAVILFLPSLLPTGNKDSRSLSRMEGVLMGLGGAVSVFPGVSSIGAMTSVASLCGTERTFALNLSFLAQMGVTVCLVFFDLLAIVSAGVGTLSFGILMGYLVAACVAFVGVFFGVRIMRTMAVNIGYNVFAFYGFALALLTFILYLMI